jgi:hypothetical protein
MKSEPSTSAAKQRRQRLSVAAALTLLATAWAAMQGDEVAPAAQATRARTAPAAQAINNKPNGSAPQITAWPDAPLSTQRMSWPTVSPAGGAAWRGPSAPKVQAPVAPAAPRVAVAKINAEPAAPEAPNFPYALIGRIDDGVPQAMLSGPTRSFGVKVNEVIDGQWRVDAVEPQSLSLTWLPGSLKKTVLFSSS